MYRTPQYKISFGKRKIAQAYDAHTAAFIALSYHGTISYIYKLDVWRGRAESLYPRHITESTIQEVANVIQRRVDDYWVREKIKRQEKFEKATQETRKRVERMNQENQEAKA